MAVKAYILVETAVGKTREVANALRKISSVQSADLITGPHDVIVVIEGEDINAVARVVERGIHPVNGVMRTVTCVVLGG